jgi:hypothetical protein
VSYRGPALVGGVRVRLHLAGRFEPVSGRYHWAGRTEPSAALVGLLRAGRRDVPVTVGARTARARLGEIDPWGGVRVTGVGEPPYDADGHDADGEAERGGRPDGD